MELHETPEFRAWAKRVRESLVPMIKNSSVVVSICDPKNIDAKLAVELGVAVMLDKPIIAVIRPGTEIPEKLAKVTDRFVEHNPELPEKLAAAIQQAVQSVVGSQPH